MILIKKRRRNKLFNKLDLPMPKGFLVSTVLCKMAIGTAHTAIVDIGQRTFHRIVRSEETPRALCLATDGAHE